MLKCMWQERASSSYRDMRILTTQQPHVCCLVLTGTANLPIPSVVDCFWRRCHMPITSFIRAAMSSHQEKTQHLYKVILVVIWIKGVKISASNNHGVPLLFMVSFPWCFWYSVWHFHTHTCDWIPSYWLLLLSTPQSCPWSFSLISSPPWTTVRHTKAAA